MDITAISSYNLMNKTKLLRYYLKKFLCTKVMDFLRLTDNEKYNLVGKFNTIQILALLKKCVNRVL